MENSNFSFQLTPTDPTAELGFEVWINDQCIVDIMHVKESCVISGAMPNDSVEAEHVLKLVLKNKQPSHTKISKTGEIISDALLEITDVKFDEVALGQIVNDLTVYQHNFNGTQSTVQQKFFGTMGCNGTVELKFTTPIYLWMLENM